jgi:hypothetical protein
MKSSNYLGILASVLLIVGITLATQEYYILGCLIFVSGIYVADENNPGMY